MVALPGKESQLLQDPGHAALKCGPPRSPWAVQKARSCMGGPFSSTESYSLSGLPSLVPAHRVGGTAGSGFLHKAVLSVSLSISSRMWPGRSLFAESECISEKMLRSGSEALELVSGQKTQGDMVSTRGDVWEPRGRGWEGESAHAHSPLLETSAALRI